jgi:hypothetical protein
MDSRDPQELWALLVAAREQLNAAKRECRAITVDANGYLSDARKARDDLAAARRTLTSVATAAGDEDREITRDVALARLRRVWAAFGAKS